MRLVTRVSLEAVDVSSLLFEELFFEFLKLLLFGLYKLKVFEHVLSHLVVVGFYLFHFIGHSGHNFSLPFPEFLKFGLVADFQFFLIFSHINLTLFLFIQSDLGNFKIPDSLDFQLELLFISLIHFILIL